MARNTDAAFAAIYLLCPNHAVHSSQQALLLHVKKRHFSDINHATDLTTLTPRQPPLVWSLIIFICQEKHLRRDIKMQMPRSAGH
jgi:hypothetical protein